MLLRIGAVIGLIFVGMLFAFETKADTLKSYSVVCKTVESLQVPLITYGGVMSVEPDCVWYENITPIVVVREPMSGPVLIRIGTRPAQYFTYNKYIDYSFDSVRD